MKNFLSTHALRKLQSPTGFGSHAVLALSLCVLLAACSPPLDWREFSPEGSGLMVTLPCRPDRYSRDVDLAGSRATMTLLACKAEGSNYSVAFVELTDPALVTATLVDWRATTVANLQGHITEIAPLAIQGMTANAQAVRIHLDGRLAEGSGVTGQAAYFVHGLRLFQGAVIGDAPSAAASDTFFAGLRFRSGSIAK